MPIATAELPIGPLCVRLGPVSAGDQGGVQLIAVYDDEVRTKVFPGDRVVAIDGMPLLNATAYKAAELLEGKQAGATDECRVVIMIWRAPESRVRGDTLMMGLHKRITDAARQLAHLRVAATESCHSLSADAAVNEEMRATLANLQQEYDETTQAAAALVAQDPRVTALEMLGHSSTQLERDASARLGLLSRKQHKLRRALRLMRHAMAGSLVASLSSSASSSSAQISAAATHTAPGAVSDPGTRPRIIRGCRGWEDAERRGLSALQDATRSVLRFGATRSTIQSRCEARCAEHIELLANHDLAQAAAEAARLACRRAQRAVNRTLRGTRSRSESVSTLSVPVHPISVQGNAISRGQARQSVSSSPPEHPGSYGRADMLHGGARGLRVGATSITPISGDIRQGDGIARSQSSRRSPAEHDVTGISRSAASTPPIPRSGSAGSGDVVGSAVHSTKLVARNQGESYVSQGRMGGSGKEQSARDGMGGSGQSLPEAQISADGERRWGGETPAGAGVGEDEDVLLSPPGLDEVSTYRDFEAGLDTQAKMLVMRYASNATMDAGGDTTEPPAPIASLLRHVSGSAVSTGSESDGTRRLRREVSTGPRVTNQRQADDGGRLSSGGGGKTSVTDSEDWHVIHGDVVGVDEIEISPQDRLDQATTGLTQALAEAGGCSMAVKQAQESRLHDDKRLERMLHTDALEASKRIQAARDSLPTAARSLVSAPHRVCVALVPIRIAGMVRSGKHDDVPLPTVTSLVERYRLDNPAFAEAALVYETRLVLLRQFAVNAGRSCDDTQEGDECGSMFARTLCTAIAWLLTARSLLVEIIRVARLRNSIEVAWVDAGGIPLVELIAADQREELKAQIQRDKALSSGSNQEAEERKRASLK